MITILNSYAGEATRHLGTAFIFLFLGLLNGILLCDTVESEPGYAITAMFNLIAIGVAVLVFTITGIQETDIEYHEAVIGTEVPFVEVMEKYEIDSRRGDIWILTAPIEEDTE